MELPGLQLYLPRISLTCMRSTFVTQVGLNALAIVDPNGRIVLVSCAHHEFLNAFCL